MLNNQPLRTGRRTRKYKEAFLSLQFSPARALCDRPLISFHILTYILTVCIYFEVYNCRPSNNCFLVLGVTHDRYIYIMQFFLYLHRRRFCHNFMMCIPYNLCISHVCIKHNKCQAPFFSLLTVRYSTVCITPPLPLAPACSVKTPVR